MDSEIFEKLPPTKPVDCSTAKASTEPPAKRLVFGNPKEL